MALIQVGWYLKRLEKFIDGKFQPQPQNRSRQPALVPPLARAGKMFGFPADYLFMSSKMTENVVITGKNLSHPQAR
jgi:hypothetical protein